MYYVYVAISNQTVQIHFSKMEETFKSINNPVGSVKTAVNKVKNTQKLKQKKSLFSFCFLNSFVTILQLLLHSCLPEVGICHRCHVEDSL